MQRRSGGLDTILFRDYVVTSILRSHSLKRANMAFLKAVIVFTIIIIITVQAFWKVARAETPYFQ